MQNIVYSLLFQIYPYVCVMVFILGSIYRVGFMPYTVTSRSSQFLDGKKSAYIFKGFHLGVIFILCGHLAGLFAPKALLEMAGISDELHAEIAHVSGGLFGLLAFVCMLMLIYRRFFVTRIQASSSCGDNFILILLFIQLSLGLMAVTPLTDNGMSAGARLVLLENYFQGIVSLDITAYKNLVGLSYINLLHIFIGWSLFFVFPFTRLIHIMFAPIHYLVRTGYQIVRLR